mgnify:CR=1 FL=1
MKNLKQRLKQGETLHGCWLNLGSSLTAEIVGQAGFDWVLIDLEHGAGSESDVLYQLQALEHTPTAALVRVETFHSFHQADVSFGNQIGYRHSVIGIVLSDLHDKSEVCPDHVGSGLRITVFDACGEGYFFFGGEERSFGNLPQIKFQAAVGFVCHVMMGLVGSETPEERKNSFFDSKKNIHCNDIVPTMNGSPLPENCYETV